MSRHFTSAISQAFGKFASKEFSPGVQNFINKLYVSLMGLDMTDFHAPSTYKSLNALFTRNLREDRKYSLDASDFISPCDSWISECGELHDDYALQIKGMRYKADDFIGADFTQEEKDVVHNGTFVNFYLSPKDYHRYHIPTNLKVLKAVHVPGKFYPVNVSSLNRKINLFIENERVVIHCETTSGKRFFMVLVSALNVGVMQVAFEPLIKTNANALKSSAYTYTNLHQNKGDDFGCFEMGSTIIILAEKDMLALHVEQGDNVKYGDTIAKLS